MSSDWLPWKRPVAMDKDEDDTRSVGGDSLGSLPGYGLVSVAKILLIADCPCCALTNWCV